MASKYVIKKYDGDDEVISSVPCEHCEKPISITKEFGIDEFCNYCGNSIFLSPKEVEHCKKNNIDYSHTEPIFKINEQ